MKKAFSFGLLAATIVLIVSPSCKKEKQVTSIKLSETTKIIVVGGEFALTATVEPVDATNRDVVWSSDKSSVATVDKGKVRGIAVGEATITVTTKDGGKSARCKVTVQAKKKPVTGVKLSETTKTIRVGEEFTLTPTIEPDDATDKTVSWTSDKPTIATVIDGKVKGVAVGEANITVTTKDGNKTAVCKVTVDVEVDKAALLDGVAYMEDKIEGVLYPYQIELVTPESAVNDKGKFIAAGIYHRFTISSTKPVNVTDKPAFGDYIVQSGNAPMTLLTKNYISYVRKINANGKFEGQAEAITAGTLTIADKKIVFDGATAKGKIKIEYNGDYKVINKGLWRYEPRTQEVKTETFSAGSIMSYGSDDDGLPSQILHLSANGDKKMLLVKFFIAKEATVFTPGTYQVEATYGKQAVGTIQKSPGEIGALLWLMSSCLIYHDGKYPTTIYFFDKGTAVVTDKDIKFIVNSHFGSTLNITYTGELTFKKNQVLSGKEKYSVPLKP